MMSQRLSPKGDPEFIEEVGTHKDDDLVDSVDELWWEMAADRSHHQILSLRFYSAFPHITEIGCAKVACHDNDGVSEVHHSTLAVREPPIIKDLQE